MVCANCGTEIADKAIVCFRCGQPTVAAVRQPAPRPSRLRGVWTLIAFLILAAAALFLGRAGTVEVPAAVRWSVMAAAVALLVWRFVARRR
jgi:NhaP-type Na+/H+ or K+/H+ antiporter